MKNVRVLFAKKDRMKFVSHLDMNRFMNRMLRLSGIPIWFTEGFNPHPYITFALPLPLGFESDYEIIDFKCIDDLLEYTDIENKLKKVMPEYIEIKNVFEPKMKSGKIAFSSSDVTFFTDDISISERLEKFLNRNEIIIEKKTKRGNINVINVAEKIKAYSIQIGDRITVSITLPSGSEENINPQSVFEVFKKENTDCPYFNVKRTGLFDAELNLFV